MGLGRQKGGAESGGKGGLRPVAWALFVSHVRTVVLSWEYFFRGAEGDLYDGCAVVRLRMYDDI